MATRREIKQDALARVRAEKEARRARKAELRAMSADERRAAKAADHAEKREQKKRYKAERKAAKASMSRAERREAKRRERVYRKVKHRPRRAIGWFSAVAIVTVLAVLAAPSIADISRLLSLRIDTSTAAGAEARAQGERIAEQISDEGIVLLKNEDEALPLAEKKLNVFSFAAFKMRFGGAGSGGADQSTAVNIFDALEGAGVAYNEELKAAMEEAGAETENASGTGLARIVKSAAGRDKTEPEPDYLTDKVMNQAASFTDTALVVIGNDGAEAVDFKAEQLRITDTQRDLLDRVTGEFDRVIVIVNSGNQMELGFLDEYPEIKGALWIGTPGPRGAVSLANILAGNVNPSGRLTDTYAYDVGSAPAAVNFGDFKYENYNRGLLNYDEGIYVGYRYYETRYEGDDEAYSAAVQFPFGYGLSYTSFEWSDYEFSAVGEKLNVTLSVTNTGEVAGKDVAQVYASAPYTEGGIEKSAAVLVGYAKTPLLEPGESAELSIDFDRRDLASWDTAAGGGYVLEQGEYKIRVNTDVHSVEHEFVMPVLNEQRYESDLDTGVSLENRFAYAEEGLNPLTRADWEASYPGVDDIDLVASDELIERMDYEYEPLEGEAPTLEADNGIMLEDLNGLDYDDPLWDAFLDQFTLDEQVKIFARGAFQTHAVERLGMPSAILLDGPAGINFFFGDVEAAAYPSEVVIASTFNDELAREMGEIVGDEANAYGVQGWYAPAMNIHRTALGGRNFEYFSEDPLLSGNMSAAMIQGAQSKGILTFMKHFALNEQEVNARIPGVNVFVSEQAMRELYLRPFEISVKDGEANGAMTSFINIGGTWAGANEDLLQGVLRDEWGFDGVVSTDAVIGGFMDATHAVRAGNDLMLAPLANVGARATEKAYKADPVGVGEGLRDRVHAVAYALLRTDLFE